jgi:hypothetical protein
VLSPERRNVEEAAPCRPTSTRAVFRTAAQEPLKIRAALTDTLDPRGLVPVLGYPGPSGSNSTRPNTLKGTTVPARRPHRVLTKPRRGRELPRWAVVLKELAPAIGQVGALLLGVAAVLTAIFQ